MIIWYIDEEQDDRLTYKRQLEKVTQNKIEIKAIEPYADCLKMAEKILLNKDTVAAVIDHRLSDSGTATYNGLELARAIRVLNDKIPLYILTNHKGDLTDDEWEIEYVFAKDDFIDNHRLIAERIKRHINLFFEFIGEREKRFTFLLKKSIKETLNAEELEEFDNLDYVRSATASRRSKFCI
jgi:hypothetical protein